MFYLKKRIGILLLLVAFFAIATGALSTESEASASHEVWGRQVLTAAEKARRVLKYMSREEKIGQLFLVTPEALTGGTTVTETSLALTAGLERYHVGGVIFFAANIRTPEQTRALIAGLQHDTKYPLFLAVDEEGGKVARVGNNPALRVVAPQLEPMGQVKTQQRAYEIGTTIGAYLQNLGFNLDFAPVADVLIYAGNKEIGNRSFGSDATLCGELAAAVAQGLESQGVIATLKHFPGHGGAESNSHEGLSTSWRTLEELRATELVAFRRGIAAGADAVMMAHLSLPKVTGDYRPASLSKTLTTDLLRQELGFEGIVITDALNMGAITENYGAAEAAVAAFEAGADVLLMPADLGQAQAALAAALASGRISEERIDAAVTKILLLKYKYGIIK